MSFVDRLEISYLCEYGISIILLVIHGQIARVADTFFKVPSFCSLNRVYQQC